MRPFQRSSRISWVAGLGILLIAAQARAAAPEQGISGGALTRADLGQLLNPSDRLRVESTKAWSLMGDVGSSSFTLRAARNRSPRPQEGAAVNRRDRFTTYEIGFDGRTDLSQHLTLVASGLGAVMNRRMAAIEVDVRSRMTFLGTAGLAIVDDGGSRIAFDYVHAGPVSSRSSLVRMSELLGGAPPTASGFRLSLSRSFEPTLGTAVEWRLTASAMTRADRDAQMVGAPTGRFDRNLVAQFRMSF